MRVWVGTANCNWEPFDLNLPGNASWEDINHAVVKVVQAGDDEEDMESYEVVKELEIDGNRAAICRPYSGSEDLVVVGPAQPNVNLAEFWKQYSGEVE